VFAIPNKISQLSLTHCPACLFSQILNDGPDDAAGDGSPHCPVVWPVGPSSFSQTRCLQFGKGVVTLNVCIFIAGQLISKYIKSLCIGTSTVLKIHRVSRPGNREGYPQRSPPGRTFWSTDGATKANTTTNFL